MPDVYIKVDHLNRLNGSLKQIIVEFTDAAERTNALQDMIDRPDGRSGLRDKTHDFEGGWDDRRSALIEKLTGIQSAVESTCSGWQEFDAEAAQQLTVSEYTGDFLPTR
ncbi:flagellar protein FlgN [Mycetocola manganoxydans]|uniref:Flagellar protein FlgN n=1 Tax=Mycetocola manganoxydans TaxID=699879 RepID=A0A3L6ZVD4_9MICO|nr:flagellar protein FlgN [Mycetocola manganoxydans]RLP71956.1 flagellar protein FlgN [Mycetocola manganoxydans]GHD47273.1 hypothetical protein GCM10008097_18010 [Mycetocola manganoxydans]